jgi:Immunoglobulin-like domain of bacterial spore germination/Sporulation and spore germination
MSRLVVRLLVVVLIAGSLLGGRTPVGAQAAQEPKDPWVAEVGEPTLIKLYFVRNGRLAVVHRVIPMPEGKEIARATTRELLTGPTTQEQAFGVDTGMPLPCQLVDIQLDEANARITVTLDYRFTLGADDASVRLRFAQVVYTLTQFRNVSSVRVYAERSDAAGKAESTEVVANFGRVFDRRALDDTLPSVFFDSPATGDTIASPLRLTGYANVFEAQFSVRLVDLAGNELGSRGMRADWGEHAGSFDEQLDFDPAASSSRMVILVVPDWSPRAASERTPDAANIPLWLET